MQPPADPQHTLPVADEWELEEIKRLVARGKKQEALPRLYKLAAGFPQNLEIQDLIRQCLNEPGKSSARGVTTATTQNGRPLDWPVPDEEEMPGPPAKYESPPPPEDRPKYYPPAPPQYYQVPPRQQYYGPPPPPPPPVPPYGYRPRIRYNRSYRYYGYRGGHPDPLVRLLYFLFVGCWLGPVWLVFALLFCCSIILTPVGLRMLPATPRIFFL